MVEYLKTKKGYFYKFNNNGEKKRISQAEYNKKNKTRKNKKIVGSGTIKEITEDDNEFEFEQGCSVINYGSGSISTYNLVNCLAIGGVFKLNEKNGTFLTHESPTDYLKQQCKLRDIKKILDTKNATITQIVLFRIDEPGTDVYKDGLTTEKIIDLMNEFSVTLFDLNPKIINYSCDILTMKCGKAIISPIAYNSVLIPFVPPKTRTLPTEPSGTFIVEVLYNKDNKKIFKCPICKVITGTYVPENPNDTSKFVHKYNCDNANKIPIENA